MIGCQCERWGVNIAIALNYKIYKCMMLVQWYSARQNAGNKSEKKDACKATDKNKGCCVRVFYSKSRK